MIGIYKYVFMLLACLASWTNGQEDNDLIESLRQLELFRLDVANDIPFVSRENSLSKPSKFRRPTTTRRPFRKRPSKTTPRPPAAPLPEVESPAPAPPLLPPLIEESTAAPPLPLVPEEILVNETLAAEVPQPVAVQPAELPPVLLQPQPAGDPLQPSVTVSESQPPFDNSPYKPPSPPPAPPAILTMNPAVIQAPPGRPQRPLPPPKPNRPNFRPPIVVRPTIRPPTELITPDEEPALVYSESSMSGNGDYYFNFQVSNSIFRKEQGFTKKSLIWPGHLVHVKTGAYSFTSPEGTLHRIDFVADENGYRAFKSG